MKVNGGAPSEIGMYNQLIDWTARRARLPSHGLNYVTADAIAPEASNIFKMAKFFLVSAIPLTAGGPCAAPRRLARTHGPRIGTPGRVCAVVSYCCSNADRYIRVCCVGGWPFRHFTTRECRTG